MALEHVYGRNWGMSHLSFSDKFGQINLHGNYICQFDNTMQRIHHAMKKHTNIQIETRFTRYYFSACMVEGILAENLETPQNIDIANLRCGLFQEIK